jgi:hypothetical protein
VLVGAIALLLTVVFAISILAGADWDATVFVGFGEESTAITEYAQARLGDVKLRPQLGHDGRFFFVQANDPWLLAPDENASILDRPAYRSQRMLYPTMAGGLGTFPPQAVVWGLLVVNVLAMALGSWAVAVIASEMGASPWWGLAFVLNLGLVSELTVDGAGVIAAAAAFGSIAMLKRGRTWPAVALMALATLAREVMLVAALGSAFYLWRRQRRRDAIWMAVVPAACLATWALYARLRIGLDSGGAEILEIGLPFAGFLEALRGWTRDPIDLVVGLTLLLIMALFVWRTIESDHLVGWAFLGFVPLAVLLTEPVWRQYFNSTRAIAPVLTAFVLVAFAAAPASKRTSVRQ